MEFSFLEINALNKLLGKIKSEPSMTAEDLNFFALSPFIISAFEKIHREYMTHIREQQNTGQRKTIGLKIGDDSKTDFQFTAENSIEDYKKRTILDDNVKKYLKTLDNKKLENHCKIIFAPFKPTKTQKQEMIEFLKNIAKEK